MGHISPNKMWGISQPTQCGAHLNQHNVGHISPNKMWGTFHPTQFGAHLNQHNVGHISPNKMWGTSHPTQCGAHLTQHNLGHISNTMWGTTYPTQFGAHLTQHKVGHISPNTMWGTSHPTQCGAHLTHHSGDVTAAHARTDTHCNGQVNLVRNLLNSVSKLSPFHSVSSQSTDQAGFWTLPFFVLFQTQIPFQFCSAVAYLLPTCASRTTNGFVRTTRCPPLQ